MIGFGFKQDTDQGWMSLLCTIASGLASCLLLPPSLISLSYLIFSTVFYLLFPVLLYDLPLWHPMPCTAGYQNLCTSVQSCGDRRVEWRTRARVHAEDRRIILHRQRLSAFDAWLLWIALRSFAVEVMHPRYGRACYCRLEVRIWFLFSECLWKNKIEFFPVLEKLTNLLDFRKTNSKFCQT